MKRLIVSMVLVSVILSGCYETIANPLPDTSKGCPKRYTVEVSNSKGENKTTYDAFWIRYGPDFFEFIRAESCAPVIIKPIQNLTIIVK